MAYSHDRLTHLSSLASEAMRRREYGQCIELLEEASKLAPKNWNILINLAQLLISRYEFEAAEKYFEKAIRVSKDEGSVCSLAAPSFFNARQNEIAIKYLHRLLKLNPQSAEVLTFLATIHERQGGMAQTADFIDAALQLKPGYVPALLIKARLLRKEGHPEAAEKVLRQIASESQAEPDLRAQAWCELGKLLDSESQFDEAISAFLSAKELLLPHAAKGLNDRRRTQAHTTMMINSVSADSLTRWKADGLAITPVHRIALLAGHPRSGTTLLEQVLDAHPDVRSLEESPIFFNEAYLPLIHRLPSENHFRALDSVSVSQLSAPRSNYFKLVERFMGLDASGSLLIDKNPSLTPFIPAFAKIFPESRFLVALRDPRDVCMSCFMQYLPMGPVAS
ncbi:MAG TPA: sulfotransferase, partial [Holophagaceae bacterium]|nr:sulfotransferase [Holophagaceae bacterium]